MTADDLDIRDFHPGDECIIQKWWNEFPFRDGNGNVLADVNTWGDVLYKRSFTYAQIKVI